MTLDAVSFLSVIELVEAGNGIGNVEKVMMLFILRTLSGKEEDRIRERKWQLSLSSNEATSEI